MSGKLRLLILPAAVGLAACQSPSAPTTVPGYAAVANRNDVMLRSDLPLWMEDGTDAVAPRSFYAETTFGCISGLLTGDWKQTFAPGPSGYQDEPVWWRVGMGGVIHCTGWFEAGTARGEDDIRLLEAGYTINLGHDEASGLDLYLWEIGVRPGSTYLVLARSEDDAENQFRVLDPSCAHGVERRAVSHRSSLSTDYCALPDQAAMRATASDAARLPPAGLMQYIGPASDDPD